MGCGGCKQKAARSVTQRPVVIKAGNQDRILAIVQNHADVPTMLLCASGRGYGMKQNGSQVMVFKEDYRAEPDKFIPAEEVDVMQCDLILVRTTPKSKKYRCIRCGQETPLVQRGMTLYTVCQKPGWGDRLKSILERLGVPFCGGCSRRRDMLNRLDRWVYRRLWGPKDATYLEKHTGKVPPAASGRGASPRPSVGARRHTGRRVPTSPGQSQRGQ